MRTRTFALRTVFSALIITTIGATLARAEEAAGPRVTASAEGFASERKDDSRRDSDLLIESVTTPGRLTRTTAKGGPQQLAAVTNGEAWIYDATVDLFDDLDNDGYYSYIRVRFDADSLYSDHWVYARLYISEDGVVWDEYHVTDDFLINGSSPFDDYEVETELVAGFVPGLYDVLIELYDADFGDFLADFGPEDSSALSLLPLEDTTFDDPGPVVIVTDGYGGGGASGWLMIAVLLLALAAARIAPKPARARIRLRRSFDKTPRAPRG
jgi:hypothetical protein